MNLTKILCLDLDGTVRRSKSGKPFIEGPDDIELMPGITQRIVQYRNLGYIIYGISNQAGVAHGFKTVEQVGAEMKATIKLLDLPFISIIACPYDAKGKVVGYNWRSLCRKPDYGMLVLVEHELCKRKLAPDWDNSLFVGDRPEDEECAKRAGIPFMHIEEFLKQPV